MALSFATRHNFTAVERTVFKNVTTLLLQRDTTGYNLNRPRSFFVFFSFPPFCWWDYRKWSDPFSFFSRYSRLLAETYIFMNFVLLILFLYMFQSLDDNAIHLMVNMRSVIQKAQDFPLFWKISKWLPFFLILDENEPPSFQCLKCTYGFNLDWSSTSLEDIFQEKLKNDGKSTQQEENISKGYGVDAKNKTTQSLTTSAQSYSYQMPTQATRYWNFFLFTNFSQIFLFRVFFIQHISSMGISRTSESSQDSTVLHKI